MEHIDITTPENVNLRFKVAGLGSRTTAQIIDITILTITIIIFSLGLYYSGIVSEDSTWTGYLVALFIIVFFVLWWGYFVFFEFFDAGRTIGKRFIGIRVIQDNGQSITFISSMVRNLLRLIDFLPTFYLLGIIMLFLHPRHKRIGDLAAGTIVVYERNIRVKKKDKQFEKELTKRKIDAKRIQLDEWTIQKIKSDEWKLLKTYISRRSSLSKKEREEIATKVANIIFPMIGYEEKSISLQDLEDDLSALYLLLKDEWQFEI